MLKHKNAVGTFSDHRQIELALEQLKSVGILMSNISVIVPQPDSGNP
jgi:hypothetical protein